MSLRLLADGLLILHFAFVGFVVGGQVLVLIGWWRRWRWVRGMAFRLAHLCAIAFVVLQDALGFACPLTIWEYQLRSFGGHAPEDLGCIAYWLQRLFLFDAERWMFTVAYSLFGLLVLASWWGCPPYRKRKLHEEHEDAKGTKETVS